MQGDPGPAIVAVVGAGASGTLTALHTAREARAAGRQVQILLVEPSRVGEGLAYSTRDPRHRLNVPARGMSAYPDDPEHFLRWLRGHVAVDYPVGGFAPRLLYAEYLAGCLRDETDAEAVRVTHVEARVTDVRRHGRRLRLTLDDGTSRPADSVVFAMGHGSPSLAWAPEALRRSHRFVGDPWRASSAPAIKAGDDVVLVGAGLTMADMATRWGRAGVRVHVVSRHGLMPLPHAREPQPPAPAPALPEATPVTLRHLRRIVFDQVRAADGDWRRAIDGLRPVTCSLWSRMDDDARRGFLRVAARRWDRVRHRIDPALDAWLNERVADGSLIVHAAEVTGARETVGGIAVDLSDGTSVTAAAVLNCTGTCVAVQQDEDPLVLNLLDAGTARPGPLDLGFATGPTGRITGTTGEAGNIWAIGPLRRGQLWESTAIPEIRAQAAEIAADVVAALPASSLRRRARDRYGSAA